MAVWEQVSAQGHRPYAAQVKRLLTEERVPGAAAVARFVGVDAYEAAGGAVMRDLFADEHEHGVWFEDPVLLEKLATDKLQAAADELSTRWKWAVPMIEAGWDDTAPYGRIEPQPGVPTDEERAEIEKLETRHDELRGLDDDEWTEELLEEAGRIEARLDEIEGAVEARAMWRREDFAMAGCIATIGRDGALQVIAGLVKPEDMPKPDQSGGAAAQAGNGPDAAATGVHTAGRGVHTAAPAVSRPIAGPRDREAEARKEAGVGIGLADDLRAIRTALVKAKLAGDFGAAFDLLLFQMGRAVFVPGYSDHALDIAVKETPDRPNTRMNDADFADWSPGETMLADRSHLSFDWLEIEDDGESFAALRALPQAEKEALFAACVARTVKGQLAFEPQARPELEATAARLDIDFAGPCPSDRRHAVVAVHQGARPRHRPHGVRPGLGVGPIEVQEAGAGRGDGGRLRRRRPAGRGERRDARQGARLGPAGIRGVRHGPDGRRRRADGDGSRRDRTGRPGGSEEPAVDSGTDPAKATPAGNGHATEADPNRNRRTARRRMPATAPPKRSIPVRAPIPAMPGRRIPTRPSRAVRTASPRPVRSLRFRLTAKTPARTRWISPSSSAASSSRPAPRKRPASTLPPAGRFRFRIPHGGPPMNRTIRARIHESAVKRVTHIYAATLADIFAETLQNSRRAGATRVRISVAAPAAAPDETAAAAGETRSPSRSPTTAPASPIPPSC